MTNETGDQLPTRQRLAHLIASRCSYVPGHGYVLGENVVAAAADILEVLREDVILAEAEKNRST